MGEREKQMNVIQQEKTAEEQWNHQLILLQQLSQRLLSTPFSDTYGGMVDSTQRCLEEMRAIAENFPGFEPFGNTYRDSLLGLRKCLESLQESLKLMHRAKEAAYADGSNSGWRRVLESTR